jgi:hypothetical protein
MSYKLSLHNFVPNGLLALHFHNIVRIEIHINLIISLRKQRTTKLRGVFMRWGYECAVMKDRRACLYIHIDLPELVVQTEGALSTAEATAVWLLVHVSFAPVPSGYCCHLPTRVQFLQRHWLAQTHAQRLRKRKIIGYCVRSKKTQSFRWHCNYLMKQHHPGNFTQLLRKKNGDKMNKRNLV